MRYYEIAISDPATSKIVKLYTSYVNGQSIPGALNVEMDIPVTAYHVPAGAAWCRIWGIPLIDISQASKLDFMNITIKGGMQKGLPLANPAQAGLLVQGQIFQAFGNWIGTAQTLDLILQPSTGSLAAPKNIVWDWRAKTPIAQALRNCFSVAYPTFKQRISVNPKVVRNNDEIGIYSTLEELAVYVNRLSKAIIGGAYLGITISIQGDTITATDGTQVDQAPASSVKAIAFQDLIGQPTWLDGLTMQAKVVMRADLDLNSYITMPKTLVTTTSASQSSLVNLKTAFQGKFYVTGLRHLGNFRQPDASSWVTVIDSAAVVSG